MTELGSYWCFYSLLYLCDLPDTIKRFLKLKLLVMFLTIFFWQSKTLTDTQQHSTFKLSLTRRKNMSWNTKWIKQWLKIFGTYLKDHVGTLTEHMVIGRVNWCLFCELAVKLAYIILTTLAHKERKHIMVFCMWKQGAVIMYTLEASGENVWWRTFPMWAFIRKKFRMETAGWHLPNV